MLQVLGVGSWEQRRRGIREIQPMSGLFSLPYTLPTVSRGSLSISKCNNVNSSLHLWVGLLFPSKMSRVKLSISALIFPLHTKADRKFRVAENNPALVRTVISPVLDLCHSFITAKCFRSGCLVLLHICSRVSTHLFQLL